MRRRTSARRPRTSWPRARERFERFSVVYTCLLLNETKHFPMPSQRNDLIPTRWTLIQRLKKWDDHEGWREFFDTYWRLIYATALKSGLVEVEAQEVVQETVISVCRKIGEFEAS